MRGHRGESDFLDISGSAARVRPNFQEKFKWPDRKSTRLNSSHDQISYAVFCLKKKKTCSLEISDARTLRDHPGCIGDAHLRIPQRCLGVPVDVAVARSLAAREQANPVYPRRTV